MVSLLLPLVFCAADIALPDQDFRQPQPASQGRNVALVFGGGNNIYYAGSADHGNTFSAPVAVAQTTALALGNHRGPRIAFAGDAIIITSGVGHQLVSWRSTDDGKTWAAGPRIAAVAGEGFHGLGSDGKQRLFEAWLAPADGHLKLFGAHSEDAGVSWSEPQVVYQAPEGNVCECCHPSVALVPDGEVVMFRNSLAGARDFYLARSKDGASFTIAKLGEGTWPLKACPMDGGGIAIADGKVVTAWRRNFDIFLARPGQAEKSSAKGGIRQSPLERTGSTRSGRRWRD